MRMFAKIFIALMVAFVQGRGDYCPYDGELTARSTPSITIFNQSLYAPFDELFASPDDGMECTWTIESAEASKFVRLNFVTFHIFNTSGIKYGDCVTIYDGKYYSTHSDDILQELCNRMPEPVYNSTGRYLTVVFKQRGFGGRRWLTMNYTMVSSTGNGVHPFWSTTIGRILSFIIVISLLSVCSLLLKACKNGSLSDGCSILLDCLRQLLRLCSRCSNLFKSRTEGSPGPSPRDEPTPMVLPSERYRDGAETITTEIVTISGSHRSASAPNFSFLFSTPGAGTDISAMPPDYFTVLSRSRSVSSTSSAGSEGGEESEWDPAPDYESAVSSAFRTDSVDSFSSLSHQPPLPPPPDDHTAPPSYEVPEPPSYHSLFTETVI